VRSRGAVGLYQLVNETAPIRVTVSGPRSLISSLTSDSIDLEFDLRALPIGIHTVPLVVELPPRLSLVGSPPVLVVQIHEPAASTNGDNEELTPIPSPEQGEEIDDEDIEEPPEDAVEEEDDAV
jgi:hypothetical protein